MVAYTYSKLPTINFNTTPASIARSATGSVYDVGDTGFTTPLNMTMVIGGAVVTTISSDALGVLPDFTLLDRVKCVWKQTGSSFATVLTTSDPIPGPPGPNTVPTQSAIQSEVTTPGTPTAAALTATYASYISLAKNPDSLIAGAVTVDANNLVTSAAVVWPDGTPGTLTITSRDATNAVTAYNITYGSPVTKTYTQPTITRNAAGAATNVPQIVVS